MPGVLTGLTGKTHHGVEDLAIMRAMPGMTIVAPIDSTECEVAMRWATEYEGPVYLRLARDLCPDVFDAGYEFSWAKRTCLKGVRMCYWFRPVRKVNAAWRLRICLTNSRYPPACPTCRRSSLLIGRSSSKLANPSRQLSRLKSTMSMVA
jgi:Transketolase, pyrimidine binding domain